MTPKELEDKFFTEVQIFHLQKVEVQKYGDRCFFFLHPQRICASLNDNEQLILCTGVG